MICCTIRYILWALCFFQMRKGHHFSSVRGIAEFALNVLILITGLFFFIAGTYASVQSIINSYAAGAIKAPFQCTNTGFTFTQ